MTKSKFIAYDKNDFVVIRVGNGKNDKDDTDGGGGAPPFLATNAGGNPYHDPKTGRFAEAPTETLDKLSQMANDVGVAFSIEDVKEGTGVLTTLDNGALVVKLDKKLLDKSELTALQIAHSKWVDEHTIPYGASHVIAVDKGYDNYAEYVLTHEIGHYKMYNYTKKLEKSQHSGMEYSDGPKSWKSTVQKSISNGWKAPTYYSKTDYGEMFAECYALHEYGYDSMLDPGIIDYIRIVNDKWE